MEAFVFPLEGLWGSLQAFALSTSGNIEAREGLSLGWLAGVLAGLAVFFGSSEKAAADYCYGIPVDQCEWVCEGTSCPDGPGTLAQKYCHPSHSCMPTGQYQCGC